MALLKVVQFVSIGLLLVVQELKFYQAQIQELENPDFGGFASTLEQGSCMNGRSLPKRAHVASIIDFGGVGDGTTLNTKAFREAVSYLRILAKEGGAQLNIPPGKWVTGSFNLTSSFTLYLEKGAVILGSQNADDWPLIDPLPSYGRGRERPGGRHISLVHGESLVDVIITGENGTIDGQGSIWWEMWLSHTLKYTRGHLLEFVHCENIIISNIVLLNSPFWTLHPVYCNNMVVKGVTILAPYNSPNTDGIDPDSSSNICIEDCYISCGDDLISLKSGWDEYGIAFHHPTTNISIHRITGTTPTCSGIAFGSEMSGGISNIFIKDVHVFNTSAGIRLKTAPGRGGFITNITIVGMRLQNVKRAFAFSGDIAEHPDDKYNPNSLPLVKGILVKNLTGERVGYAGRFIGLKEAPFLDIFLSSIHLNLLSGNSWICSHVEGYSSSVSPLPCTELQNSNGPSVAYVNTSRTSENL
eukprot:c29668_g1_i1 orf=65-1477(-)